MILQKHYGLGDPGIPCQTLPCPPSTPTVSIDLSVAQSYVDPGTSPLHSVSYITSIRMARQVIEQTRRTGISVIQR